MTDRIRGLMLDAARLPERALGVITTNWVPGRYLPGADLDGLAYAAVAMGEGIGTARVSAFERFVSKHFGAEWDPLWADIFHTLYDVAPCQPKNAPAWADPSLPVPWHDEESLGEALGSGPGYPLPYDRLLAQMDRCRPAIRRNHGDFEALCLSVAYLRHIHWRRDAVAVAAKGGAAALEDAVSEVASKDAEILRLIRETWQQDRPPRVEGARDVGLRGSNDLLGAFARAAGFSAELSRNPGLLAKIAGQTGGSA